MADRAIVWGVLGLLAAFAAAAGAAPGQTDLVTNGSFEAVEGGVPVGWSAAGDSSVAQSLSVGPGKEGKNAAVLRCIRFEQRSPSSHAMLAQVGKVRLVNGQMYLLSCWIRGEGLRSGRVRAAISDMSVWASCGLEAELSAGPQWRRVEKHFTASRTAGETTRLQFWFTETGTLWMDDVSIVPAERVKAEFTDQVEPTGSTNLLANGSFEVGPVGWSSLGAKAGWGNLSRLYGEVQEGGAKDGGRCLRIEVAPGKTPVTYFDYFEPVRVEQRSPLAANVGWVKVARGQKYTLSCWMRADRAAVPARLLVRQCDAAGWPADQDHAATLTDEWQRLSMTVTASRDFLFVAAGPDLARGGPTAATVLLDAVQLEAGPTATAYRAGGSVEVAIETGKLGNVFALDEAVALSATVHNTTDTPVAMELAAEIEDFFGHKTAAKPCRIEAPAGGTSRQAWPLELKRPGWYRATVAWRQDDRARTRRLVLAVIRPYEAAESSFGINHAPPTVEFCRLLRLAGLTWARDWSLKWQHLEPKPGQFDPGPGDTQIDRVREQGMNVTCLLPPFPSSNWASAAPQSLATKGYPGNRLRMAYAPKDPNLLAEYVERCARHLKGRVRYYEFLNEPIYTTYSLPAASKQLPGSGYTVKDYVRLLALASAAMKRADGDCRVIGGIGSGPDHMVGDLIDAGALEHMDALDIHIYPGGAAPEYYIEPMARLSARLKAGGKPMPVWLTEYSYYAADEPPWRPYVTRGNDWAGNRLLADERQCAEYSVRFAIVMLAGGVEKIFYHSGACGEVNQPNLECCLLDYGPSPRKVYAAQAAMAGVLGERPRFAARVATPEVDGLYAFAFQCGPDAVVVAWTNRGEGKPWLLRPTTPVATYDIMGAPLSGEAAPLSTAPVYLVSRALSAERLAASCRFVPAER